MCQAGLSARPLAEPGLVLQSEAGLLPQVCPVPHLQIPLGRGVPRERTVLERESPDTLEGFLFPSLMEC